MAPRENTMAEKAINMSKEKTLIALDNFRKNWNDAGMALVKILAAMENHFDPSWTPAKGSLVLRLKEPKRELFTAWDKCGDWVKLLADSLDEE